MSAEPIIVIVAFISDYFFGKNAFTNWFGWWLFLSVVICMPAHIYSYILKHTLGKDKFAEQYSNPNEWLVTHKTFLYAIYYTFFLYFWWKWL